MFSRVFPATCGLAFLLAATGLARADTPTATDSLVMADRAFAAVVHDSIHSMRASVFLADVAVFSLPAPDSLPRDWESWTSRSARAARLTAYAEASVAGDLGFTRGPCEGGAKDSASVAFGSYVSVWEREPGGAWRIAASIEVAEPRPLHGIRKTVLRLGSGGGDGRNAEDFSGRRKDEALDRPSAVARVAAWDRDLSRDIAHRGLAAAVDRRAGAGVHVAIDGWPPAESSAELMTAPNATRKDIELETQSGGWSRSADLAYSFGRVRGPRVSSGRTGSSSGVYLNVWRRALDRRWRLALIAIVMPPR